MQDPLGRIIDQINSPNIEPHPEIPGYYYTDRVCRACGLQGAVYDRKNGFVCATPNCRLPVRTFVPLRDWVAAGGRVR